MEIVKEIGNQTVVENFRFFVLPITGLLLDPS